MLFSSGLLYSIMNSSPSFFTSFLATTLHGKHWERSSISLKMFENIWKCHIFTYFQTFSNIFTHFHGKNETVHFYYYTSKNFFREIATFGIRTIFHRSKKRVKIFENIWKFLKIIQTYRWTLSLFDKWTYV